MKKLSLMLFVGMLLAAFSVYSADDSSRSFDSFSKDEDKTESSEEAKKDANKFRPNKVLWQKNLKFAKNAERMLKYYRKKKDKKKVRFYSLKVQGFKLRAKGYKTGNKKMVEIADKYLLKGKPIPKPKPKPKKDGGGGAAPPPEQGDDNGDMGGM
jgi:hypothetical protein